MALARARAFPDGSTGAVVGLTGLGRRPARWSIRAARSESSGFLHQLLPEAPDPLDVLVPRERRVDVDGPWRFIRETPGARPARSVKDPPRLTVESTVLDLTDVRDAGEVVGLITTAIQRRRTTVRRLRREPTGASPASRITADLLFDVGAGAESPIELR